MSGRVLGLDPATKTGYAVLQEDGALLSINAKDFSAMSRFDRWVGMRNWIEGLLGIYMPNLVVIEGYGYGNVNTLATLVEYGTVYRMACMDLELKFIEVPPTTLKSFVCHSGAAKKDEVRLQVYKKWGIEHPSNDAVDAYAAAQYGRLVMGWVPATETQKKLLDKQKFDKNVKFG